MKVLIVSFKILLAFNSTLKKILYQHFSVLKNILFYKEKIFTRREQAPWTKLHSTQWNPKPKTKPFKQKRKWPYVSNFVVAECPAPLSQTALYVPFFLELPRHLHGRQVEKPPPIPRHKFRHGRNSSLFLHNTRYSFE